MEQTELCVVDIATFTIWGFAATQEQAQEKLARAIKRTADDLATWKEHCEAYPDVAIFKGYLRQEKAKTWVIMDYAEFLELERNYMVGGLPEEIDEGRFNEMLNVLPPEKWCKVDGVEMFCMSEMSCGTYASQFAHDSRTGKFWEKTVDILDRKTWINEYLK